MQRLFSLLLLLSFGLPLKAEETAAPETQTALYKVSTIESVEAFIEFQRNVRMVQSQRERILELSAQIARAGSNEKLIAGLEEERQRVLESLERNNQQMIETYGFSITRDYTVVVEKAHIYMVLTPEEAAELQGRETTGETPE